MRRRMAVTIPAALFAVVAAPALAQNSEPAPAAAAPIKSKPKTPAGRCSSSGSCTARAMLGRAEAPAAPTRTRVDPTQAGR